MTIRTRSTILAVLLAFFLSLTSITSPLAHAQAVAPKLSVHWEELTAADFREGIHRSQGTCLLPFGILEKHGPHLPLGTDLLDVRYAALHAAEKEFAVVFPEYYFGQIAEARHEPGTVAYSRDLQLALLQETTDEMARNGCKKVIIVNGHGGNESLLPFFAQSQLDKPHDYVVYVFDKRSPESGGPPKKTTNDMHAGESETSKMMVPVPTPSTSTAPPANPAPTSTAKNFPKTSIPASGGTPAFPTTTPAKAPLQLRSWEDFKWIGGSTLSPRQSGP